MRSAHRAADRLARSLVPNRTRRGIGHGCAIDRLELQYLSFDGAPVDCGPATRAVHSGDDRRPLELVVDDFSLQQIKVVVGNLALVAGDSENEVFCSEAVIGVLFAENPRLIRAVV